MRFAPGFLVLFLVGSLASAQTPSLALFSPAPENQGRFGWSVAGVGDVSGDGVADFIVGAPQEDVGGLNDAGRAHVYSGRTGNLLRALTSPNGSADAEFGYAVAGLTDTNGDGRPDYVVTAPVETPVGSPAGAGRAYIFSGTDGSLLQTLVSPNERGFSRYGESVAGVGDLDGDGREDVIVGAPSEDSQSNGVAYVYSGQTGSLLLSLFSPNSERSGLFGGSVAGTGDINGDGVGDLLVGAQFEDPGSSPENAGRAYVFSGSDGALLYTLTSPMEFEDGRFGTGVAGPGDVTGDGVPDLLVGARGDDPDPGALPRGRAYLFSGATGALIRTLVSPNPPSQFGNVFGSQVATLGDVDGDGVPDLGVSDPFQDVGTRVSAGVAYVYSGRTGRFLLSFASDQPASGGQFGGQFVPAFAGLGDSDGDGSVELLVGEFNGIPVGANTRFGSAYVFGTQPRSVNMYDGSEGWRLTAPAAGVGRLWQDLLAGIFTQGVPGGDVSSGDPNVFAFDETTQTFAPLDLRGTGTTGQGLAVYVFEDDDPFTPGPQGGFPKNLSSEGIEVIGTAYPFPVTYTDNGGVSNSGWNAFGNPFDAFMDWDDSDWVKTNVDNVLYVYDAASSSYQTWNGSTGSLGSGVIPAYTGFWVKAFDTPTLIAPPDARTTVGPAPRPTSDPILEITADAEIAGSTRSGAVAVHLSENAQYGRDGLDAYAVASLSSDWLDAYIPDGGERLSIHAQPVEPVDLDIAIDPVSAAPGANTEVTLRWDRLENLPSGWTAVLTDTETGADIDLLQSESYTFTTQTLANAARARSAEAGPLAPRVRSASAARGDGSSRFRLRLGASATAGEDSATDDALALRISPNPVRGVARAEYLLPEAGSARVLLLDALGREVLVLATGPHTAGRHTVSIPTTPLSPGAYIVRVETEETTTFTRLTVLR
ncbi:MAG: FG-GAP-like repeat-containing protein [Bacteroidota bacterium]